MMSTPLIKTERILRLYERLPRFGPQGFTLVELLSATAMMGFMLLGIAQLAIMDSRVRQSGREVADFTDLRRELLTNLSREGTCTRTFATIVVPANFYDPLNNVVDPNPTPIALLFDGLTGTPNPFIVNGQRRGNLIIAGNTPGLPGYVLNNPGLGLRKLKVFSMASRTVGGAVYRKALVLFTLRTTPATDATGTSWGGYGGGNILGQNDSIPLTIEINTATGAIVSCVSSSTTTSDKGSVCPPGQIVTMGTTGVGDGFTCRNY